MEAAFENLPEVYRIVVMLADVEELSYQEIAEALDVPLGTVTSRLNRGRRQLRQALAGPARADGVEAILVSDLPSAEHHREAELLLPRAAELLQAVER